MSSEEDSGTKTISAINHRTQTGDNFKFICENTQLPYVWNWMEFIYGYISAVLVKNADQHLEEMPQLDSLAQFSL